MADTSGAKKMATPGLEDRISALPDGVLEHILGFLPADQAMRTSILARRWRPLWQSMRRLRITELDDRRFGSPAFGYFIDGLLSFRNNSMALDEAELLVLGSGEVSAPINSCIQRLLFCQAKVLTVRGDATFCGPPLISQHLRRLLLDFVCLENNSLDFERCPTLEDLRMIDCHLSVAKILSQSVKHLSITGCFFTELERIHVSAPNLVSMEFSDNAVKAPLFEKMLSLETAVCSIGFWDCCACDGASGRSCDLCLDLHSDDGHKTGAILGGLLNAAKLELRIDSSDTLIQGNRCPTFSRLKVLLLEVPDMANDLRSLVCILEHAPVLEKLTLQLSTRDYKRTEETRHCPMDQLPAISEHLHSVEIKCTEVDENACYILKFLGRFIKRINIILNGAP